MNEKIFIFDEFHWLKEDFERNRASVLKKRPVVRCVHGKKVFRCTRGCRETFTETVDARATELWRQQKEKLFIEKAKSVHPDAYGYSNVHYTGALENVNITCLTCERDFPQGPAKHLQGVGCPTCGVQARADKQRKTLDEFVREANEVHEHKYTYPNFVYVNDGTSGLITCPKHGDFPQTPNNHLQGRGCPMCKNQTEGLVYAKLKEKLEILGFKVEHMGNRVSEGVGKMDIRITKGCLTIYVEIDGPHHFRDMPHHKSRVKDVQTKDLEKHLKARAKGQRVIRIDQDWIWGAYTKKSKSCTWFARLQDAIQNISNGGDPGIDEMFLSDDHEKYRGHPCYQKEAVKEIISTSDITIR